MPASKEFTPREFFQLVRELNEHEAELKIKLAKAGVAESTARKSESEKGEAA